MLVQSVEAVMGCRWWVIQYTTVAGETIRHSEGSFASKGGADKWAKEYFRVVKQNPPR